MIIGFSKRNQTVIENVTTITLDVRSLRLSELDFEVEFSITEYNTLTLPPSSQFRFNSTEPSEHSVIFRTLYSGDQLINGIEIIFYDDPFPEEHERYVIDIFLWKGYCYHDGFYFGDYHDDYEYDYEDYEYDYEDYEYLYDQYGNLTDYFCQHTIYIEDNDG